MLTHDDGEGSLGSRGVVRRSSRRWADGHFGWATSMGRPAGRRRGAVHEVSLHVPSVPDHCPTASWNDHHQQGGDPAGVSWQRRDLATFQRQGAIARSRSWSQGSRRRSEHRRGEVLGRSIRRCERTRPRRRHRPARRSASSSGAGASAPGRDRRPSAGRGDRDALEGAAARGTASDDRDPVADSRRQGRRSLP